MDPNGANVLRSGWIGPGTDVHKDAAILPFEKVRPQYWTKRPPLSQQEIADIADALPASLTGKLSESEQQKVVEAVGHYIYESYATNSSKTVAEIVSNDPLLQTAFGAGIWMIPDERIFSVDDIPGGTKARKNAIDQKARQETKAKELVDFILELPRSPENPRIFSSTRSPDQYAEMFREIFGDPSLKVASKVATGDSKEFAAFNFKTSVALIKGLVKTHHEEMLQAQRVPSRSSRKEDYVESMIIDVYEASKQGTLAKVMNPESFEEIFSFDDTPFKLPRIADRIPKQITLEDGTTWNVRIPKSAVELSQNAKAMDNCTKNPSYAAKMASGESLVLIIEPEPADPSKSLAEQSINVEYMNLDGNWYHVQTNPHDDGRSGAIVPQGINEFFNRELNVIAEPSSGLSIR